MTTQININGSLTLDQSSGVQDDDTIIDGSLLGLDPVLVTYLTSLVDAGQLTFADDVEAAVSGDTFVEVMENDAEITNLYFSDPDGELLDGDQVFYDHDDDEFTPNIAMETIDGDSVYLWSYSDNIVIATTSNVSIGAGDVVAAFYLDSAENSLSASIEMVTFIPIDHPDDSDPDDTVDFSDFLNVTATGSLSFDFDNLDSGNFLHVTVGTEDVGLMVTGLDPVIKSEGEINKQASDSVNTSQGGDGATIGINNQMFTPGNTAVFSLVEGQTPGTYTDIDDLDFDDHFDVKDAEIFISQVQGNPSTNYTLTIGAFNAGTTGEDPEDGRSYLDNDLGDAEPDLGLDEGDSALKDDEIVLITRVVIKDADGNEVTDTSVDDDWVKFNDGGETVTVQSFDAGWTIQWFVDDGNSGNGVETFNRFHITADEGKFDIGRIEISEGITITEPVGDQLLVDDDGPTVAVALGEGSIAHNLDETIDPDGDDTANGADTYNGAETESGSAPNNGDLDDVLIAAVANDVVTIETAPDGDEAIGRLQTTGGDVASLFTVTFDDPKDFGTDGPGDLDGDGRTDTLSLVLSSETVQTNLIVTALEGTALESLSEANRTIYLVQVSDTLIEGRIAGANGVLGTGDDDYVALRITLNDGDDLANATITTEHFLPIDHDASETVATPEDPSLYDEEIGLVLASGETLNIKLDVVVEDGDDDTASDDAEVTLIDDTGGYLSIDDDGPRVDVVTDVDDGDLEALHRNLDETIDPDDNQTADNADTYKGSETESVSAPDNGDLDDVVNGAANTPVWETAPDGFDDTTSEAIGKLGTEAGDLAELFKATDVDFGTDGKGDFGSGSGRTDTLSFVLSAPVLTTLTATAVDGSVLDGSSDADREIWLVKVSDTVIEGVTAGTDGIGGSVTDDEYVIFRITITDPTDPSSSTLVYEQFAPVEHGTDTYDEEAPVLTAVEGETLAVRWTAVVEDGDDDQATDSVDVTIIDDVDTVMSIDDDGPSVSVSDDSDTTKLEALELNHDETIAPESPDGEDTYNLDSADEDDDIEQDDNGDLDDTGVTPPLTPDIAPLAAAAIGQLSTDGTGEISALFDVSTNFGTDGEGDIDTTGEDGRTDTLSLELTGDGPLETNLVATALEGTDLEGLGETERTIWLVEVSDTVVEGRIAGADGVIGTGGDDYVVFRITLVNPTNLDTAKLETDQFLPIDHGGSEDPSLYDEEIALSTVETGESLAINLVTTIEDGDDDTATDSTSVDIVDTAGGFLSFDDDGPTAAITDTGEMVIHDESDGVQNGSETEDTNLPVHTDNDQTLGSLPAVFAALGTAIGWAKSASAVVTTAGTDYGTDGEALSNPAVWSLDVGNLGVNADSGFLSLDGYKILLNVEDGIIVGRIDVDGDGDVVTEAEYQDDESAEPTPADEIAIAISIDQDGILSIAQYVAIQHPDIDDEDEWVTMDDDALVAVLTVTDGDGDINITTEEIGDAVKIEDDAPSAISFELGDIEEDDLSGPSDGINEDGSIDAHIFVTDMVVASGVNPGTDAEAIFSLSLDSTDMDALVAANAGLTSKGETVLFDIAKDDNNTPSDPTDDEFTLTGYVDVSGGTVDAYDSGTDRDVFTWVVTAVGLATMTLIDQVDHAFAGTVEENTLDIDFTDVLQVTDADGDPVPLPDDFAKYTVVDDIPIIGPIADGNVDFASASYVGGFDGTETNIDSHSLNGLIGSDENDSNDETSDGTKTYTFTDNFTDPGYIVDKEGTNDDIYVMGQRVDDDTKIEYRQATWDDIAEVWVYDEFGDLYFTNELDQETGEYTFTVLQDPPPSSLEFDFSQLDATKFLFGVVSINGDGLLVIGSEPDIDSDGEPINGKNAGDLINTSKGGGETTIGVNNQHFTGDGDPETTEQGAYFTYITGMDGGTYQDADLINPDGLIDVHSASLQVSQTQAAGSQPTGINLTVFSTDLDSGQEFVHDLDGSAGTLGEFIVVRVYDGDGTTLLLEAYYDPTDLDDYTHITDPETGYMIAFNSDGSEVMITGLEQKDWVSWETVDEHNRVLVEATAGKFDIGAFELEEPQPTPDLMVSSEVQITDFDGDYATDNYDVFIDGTGIYDDDIYDLTPGI